jgi:hypothetical protein
MEDFATAVQLYEELANSKGSVDHEVEDILTNYLAARAQNAWVTGVKDGKESLQDSRDSYEVCFNRAYELAALGKFAEAEELLNRAQGITVYYFV